MAVEAGTGSAAERSRGVASVAPLGRRFAASAIDVAIALFPIVIALALATVTGSRTALLTIAVFVAGTIAISNDITRVTRQGQSIGRQLLGIAVLDSGTMKPPTLGQVVRRNVIGGAQFGVGWHPFGFVPAFMIIVGPWPLICYGFAVSDRQWHRGLHDRWAHTVVIDSRH